MSDTVTTPTEGTTRLGMNVVGYIIGIGVFLLLIPVLPLIAVMELVDRLSGDEGESER